MGWNMAGIMVENQPTETVLGALPGFPEATGASILGYEALSMSLDADFALSEIDKWVVVSDPRFQVAWTSAICESLSQGGCRALSFIIQDVSTTHGFAWYVDGQLVRSVIYVEGELAEQSGNQLPAEDELPDPVSEDIIPVLAERITGLNMGQLFEASYTVLRNTDR